MCAGGFRGHKSSNRINYLDSFKSYCNSFDLGFLGSGGWGRWVVGVWDAIVYMSSGMFRGKESSNRIELSQLVQDLLNLVFWAPCSSGGGVGGWGWDWLGVPPTHMHMHTHARTCMHTHVYVVNMIISCKWLLSLHFCMHVHACVCLGAPSHHPYPHLPTPQPQGGTLGITQNSIVLELIKIFQFCLKI